MQSLTVSKSLRTETISVTLKFGFLQNRLDYPIIDASNSIIDRLYRDAEKWLRDIASIQRNGQLFGQYTIYLFRIPTTEFKMMPIVQPSDIEQHCLIEIVLVPVEMNQTPHLLSRCQLNIPTNCSKCTKFIAGIYKQGYRCQKCRMIFHKDCAPFFLHDCLVQTEGQLTPTQKKNFSHVSQLTFINPFVADSTDKTTGPTSTTVPVYSMSAPISKRNAEMLLPNTIIEKGICPARLRGDPFYRRYLFRLTTNVLTMTPDLSPSNVAQTHLPQPSDVEIAFLLTDINDLVLTHKMEDRDDIFEIHLRDKTVINVGKKTDPDKVQMETAVFYSSIRDQRETIINATPSPPLPPPPSVPGTTTTTPPTQKLPPLAGTESLYRIPPLGKDNEHKDLHELYAYTGEKIGEGAFGRVMGASNKSTGQEVAVKIIEKANCGEQDIRRINDEINTLYKFNHVNILKLEAYYERNDAVYLVTERMETDMCKYITESEKGYLDEDICKMLAYQVVVALRYLHANNYSHLDVKCENILISLLKPKPNTNPQNGENHKGEYPLVKLADFGYSRIIGEQSFRKTRVGTRVYNAPEIYRGTDGYNRSADMWSVGIVLYAALSGTLPYDEKGSQRAEQIVRDKHNLFGNPRWEDVSRDAKNLISDKLLVIQPTLRIKANDVLFEEWFNDFDLFTNLREIEKRTKYLLSTRHQTLPSTSVWLTGEREDPVWTQYQEVYAQSRVQTNP